MKTQSSLLHLHIAGEGVSPSQTSLPGFSSSLPFERIFSERVSMPVHKKLATSMFHYAR
jgi:hypothetical protein